MIERPRVKIILYSIITGKSKRKINKQKYTNRLTAAEKQPQSDVTKLTIALEVPGKVAEEQRD